MKNYPKILITLLFVVLLTNNLKPQISTIDSLEIIPSNPTTSDSVKVICRATFSSGGCPLKSFSFTQNGDTINMYASHSVGVLTIICHSADTLNIGKLNAGTYKLIYTLAANSVTYDIDTISFTVQQTVGVEFNAGSDEKVEIYPNPATNKITISTNRLLSSETRISIFSISVQLMKHASFQYQKQFEMDVSELNKGIYLVKIQANNGIETKKLVIQ
jgi:hypothetical protein